MLVTSTSHVKDGEQAILVIDVNHGRLATARFTPEYLKQ